MKSLVPSQIFLTRGAGRHKEKLVSFELALREAGIAPFNLIQISSIFPPYCQLISKEQGLPQLKHGQILHLVLSENATDEDRRTVTSAIGVALSNKLDDHGYLAEYQSFTQDEKEAGHHSEDLAAYMLTTILGENFDQREIWEEEKSIYRISDTLVINTQNIAQSEEGKAGLWTTVVAAAVCIL